MLTTHGPGFVFRPAFHKNREQRAPPGWGGGALEIDPGHLRFAYRAPLASDGRGSVIFLVRLKPLDDTRPLVTGRRCARSTI